MLASSSVTVAILSYLTSVAKLANTSAWSKPSSTDITSTLYLIASEKSLSSILAVNSITLVPLSFKFITPAFLFLKASFLGSLPETFVSALALDITV